LLVDARVLQVPFHMPDPVLSVGQVAAAGADEDEEPEPVLPDEAEDVPKLLFTVHPASATAVTTSRIAMMP
jgi:lactate dehydrogenase-like 2-hydroxyacid dehydrogenase